MSNNVNIDALIPREDFEVKSEQTHSQPIQTIQIRDLETSAFFFNTIRKPDFQRETNEWGTGRVSDFIKSFLEGDLIPAIILWQGGGNIFVIDGSHRLSSLAAWVLDDYGDGMISRVFYSNMVPSEQIRVAERTRRLVKNLVGSYKDHQDAILNPDKFPVEIVNRSRQLASLALQLQWVQGDASKAEASFFKINQQAAPIDRTELKLLQSRNKPNALTARAIVRAGTGHKYWSRFSDDVILEIEKYAKEINDLLFSPELRTPIKTLDLPVAGRGYSSQTLPLVFDLVNISSNLGVNSLEDDSDGQATLACLNSCLNILNRITGTHPSSLGLHPVVYFYSETGRYQPTSFFAIIEFVKELERKNQFESFTKVRKEFESFLLKYKRLSSQVVYKYGSSLKGYLPMNELLLFILNTMIEGKGEKEVISEMGKEKRFSFLQPYDSSEQHVTGTDFNKDTKSEVFLKEALKEPIRCAICGGLIHYNSISIDHIQRKKDGGLGTIDNAQLTHPYCNTTIKN
ncbi:HNH endonuclease family protein [Chloroflexota bacterium]